MGRQTPEDFLIEVPLLKGMLDSNGQDRLGGGQSFKSTYDEFQGNLIVVDLSDVDGQTEEFEGKAWLEGRVRDKLPVGWDLEWQPDWKDGNNPIALMQFADDKTALLLRTHNSGSWLPVCVMKALLSESCTKIGVGWDGNDKLKMQSTFNFQPVGIYDLSDLARKKGLAETGLKKMTEYFGYKVRKESRVARTNWATWQLSQEQIQYAAEDAYFTYLLYDKLWNLPNPDWSAINQGVLALQEGWEEQGIIRRHDGLYCSLCDKGPMNVPLVVGRHLEGNNHKKKMKNGFVNNPIDGPLHMSEIHAKQGIVAGDGENGAKLGEYRCSLCDAGPFTSMIVATKHMEGERHQKKIKQRDGTNSNSAEELSEEHVQQGIVSGDGTNGAKFGEYMCSLCDAGPFGGLIVASKHIEGQNHQKKVKQTIGCEPCDEATALWCASQSITVGDGLNDLKIGEYSCALCSQGPFGAMQVVMAHVSSKKHQFRTQEPSAKAEDKKDPIIEHTWNFPDYVDVQGSELSCTLCGVKAAAVIPMFMHLGGDKHAKKCRASNNEELMYVKEQERMELVSTGKPVVRTGFKAPRKPEKQDAVEPSKDSVHLGQRNDSAQADHRVNVGKIDKHEQTAVASNAKAGPPSRPECQPLPPEWQEFTDVASGCKYYFNSHTQASTWDRPGPPAPAQIAQAPAAQAHIKSTSRGAVDLKTSPSAAGYSSPKMTAPMRLPPGWQAVWNESEGLNYYADVETQASQWDTPLPYAHGDWKRRVDPKGLAFWVSAEKGMSFYEQDSAWQRLLDQKRTVYWSNKDLGLRFFEVDPYT